MIRTTVGCRATPERPLAMLRKVSAPVNSIETERREARYKHELSYAIALHSRTRGSPFMFSKRERFVCFTFFKFPHVTVERSVIRDDVTTPLFYGRYRYPLYVLLLAR